jgi:sensor histidine kinase YesM
LISFYIPYGVFPGWNTERFAGNVARLGFPKWIWYRIVNSTVNFIPAVIFAYSIIYILLPRQLFTKKNSAITLLLFTMILLISFFAQFLAGWFASWNLTKLNPGRSMSSNADIAKLVRQFILVNFPVVAGFAVIIKMIKQGWLKQLETQLIAREKATAELQLLKAQIHPHFLFNTLNNIYFLTLTTSRKAPEILTKLSDILQYILNECSRTLVPLEKELKMIQDYIALEKIRYGDRLKMDLEINGDPGNKLIPPLLLIPLVENSFKHGASKMLAQPWVTLQITIKEQYLYFLLSNSKPDETGPTAKNGHIGLNNVKKRLQLLYPEAHELKISEGTKSFEVYMKVIIAEHDKLISTKETQKEPNEYAMV